MPQHEQAETGGCVLSEENEDELDDLAGAGAQNILDWIMLMSYRCPSVFVTKYVPACFDMETVRWFVNTSS
jgi:hypothetical protein